MKKILIVFSIFSIFLLISGIFSANNYAGLLYSRQEILNTNPANVTIDPVKNFTYLWMNVTIKNPTGYGMDLLTFTCVVIFNNKTVLTIQYSPYYFQNNPFHVDPKSEKTFSLLGKLSYKTGNGIYNVSLDFKLRFSGFSYQYSNPQENFNPIRYYLSELVVVEILWTRNLYS